LKGYFESLPAQYEEMADNPGRAKDGMRIQLYAHMVIIFFIIMGNVGFFVSKRKQKLAEGK